jgi:hypothetical protein
MIALIKKYLFGRYQSELEQKAINLSSLEKEFRVRERSFYKVLEQEREDLKQEKEQHRIDVIYDQNENETLRQEWLAEFRELKKQREDLHAEKLAFNALKQTKINQLIRIRVKLSERFAKTVEKQAEPVVEVVEKKTEIDTSAWTETEIRGRKAYVDKYGNFKMFKI